MRRAGLRTRIVGGFAIGALLLSASMAFATYQTTRRYLLEGRERVSVRAVSYDARILREGVLTDQVDVVDLLRALDTGGNRRAMLYRDGGWFGRAADDGTTEAVPQSLQRLVQQGQAGKQLVRVNGVPAIVVGVPLSDTAALYEVDLFRELDQTLRTLSWVLTVVAALTAVAGAGLGWYAARYVARPLRSVAGAAKEIAAGDLSTRLDPAVEPDLVQLTTSFNDMVDRLAKRLEQDRRFAADVSHELRSPLQTLAASASVLARRRDHLDQRTGLAVGLIVEEVDRFQSLVDDLLELAKSDQPVQREEVDVMAVARRACQLRKLAPDLVTAAGDTPHLWLVDGRRIEQIVGNLLDNAARYGGGATAVRVGTAGDLWFLEVDDEGPGVSPADKATIFDRFVRGRAARARTDDDGAGLGLAIVAQHAAAHGGRAFVLDRPGGGARFRVELRREPS
ncbi:HAMP domain-containing histidine kinase [Dactylosporangium aurantiacum]|uniref:histidine kinase n=1 Tax=Dactylosporangium aurantiacum TaxID=35754 RepID=A0A9Q9MIM5_9ACTN|nr:HAMP domain-containing sensor histidine kinase [Dactylosporangium aurantiacum]MDG6108709.1 HAMP domain-containing sensor histidine kinase [Dactylosporangium aurantiacum]UWZ51072.1 HAMP domain-containing histidine kinase [Dactylosporangium aurantiacum]